MKDQTCYVCTGRLGDILNILPILEMDNEQGKRAALMVAAEFAPILEGVSYLDPVIFEDHWMKVKDAILQAKGMFNRVLVGQVAGPKKEIMEEAYKAAGLKLTDPQAESFLKDQWRILGRFQDIKNDRKLTFDRRDPEREAKLIKEFMFNRKKRNILLHLGGTTSPHPYRKLIADYLEYRMETRDYKVIDITEVKAHRFYDFIGIYELAYCVIASDSAALHLAQATPNTPVFGLIQDKPSYWHGSFRRKNWIGCCRYQDLNGLTLIPDRISNESIITQNCKPRGPEPVGIHAYSLYHYDEELCASIWKMNWTKHEIENDWIRMPIDAGTFGRDSQTVFGGETRHPFLKDVIRLASFGRRDEDYIVLTRPDCYFRKIGVKPKMPVCGARMVSHFHLHAGTIHGATDYFAFTFGWWRERQKDFPDLVMGTDPYWHKVLAEFVKMHGGTRETDLTYRRPSEMVSVKDEPWRQYNATLATHWLEKNGISDLVPPVHKQLPMKQINPAGLFPFGYNPSIIPVGAGLHVMSYRSHRWNNPKTCIALAYLNDKFEVRSNEWIDLEPHEKSTEDARLFYHGGVIWISYVRSNFPEKPMESEVIYGRLLNDNDTWTIDYRNRIVGPNPRPMEKNWIFFSHGGKLYVIYSSDPKQEVWQVDGERIEKIWINDQVYWPWGPARGGTHPIHLNGKCYRLFHSTAYGNEMPVRWRYYIGAMELNPEPPFQCIRVSQKPILEASISDEITGEKPLHHKPSVVFPGNWFLQDDKFKLALGVNDSSSYIATLGVEDLHL